MQYMSQFHKYITWHLCEHKRTIYRLYVLCFEREHT